MPANDAGVEVLPATVDADVAAALFRAWRPKLNEIGTFDLAAVTHIDSAGVALLRVVRVEQGKRGFPVATLRNVPERYRALCLAHRVPVETV